jgi:type IV pilus assembly protein PilF
MRRERWGWMLGLLVLAGCASGGGSEPAEKPMHATGTLSAAGNINLGLAQTYLQRNELQAALDRANRAIETDPSSGSVHAMLGLIYDRIGDQAHAAASFKQALALAPTEGAVLNVYGAWLCGHGDPAGASVQFDRALADPFFQRKGLVHYNVGHCALGSHDLVRAESAFRKALELPGAEPGPVLVALAEVELALGKPMDARAFVQRAESLGESAQLLQLAARIEDAAGDPAAAEKYRQRARDLPPAPATTTGQGGTPR